MNEPSNHLRRFLTIWLAACVVITPLVVGFVGPIIPPGNGSTQATGQVQDNMVLIGMATPVFLLVIIYLIYAAVHFREREGATEGPAVRGDSRMQAAWIVITSTLVLGLAVYGTVELVIDGAGGGQGPKPAFAPAGKALQVQVIAQQWAFTYRYPSYGGVETTHLELPVDTLVELHVTSLDVIHSFWAYQLGVKADANPQVDNVAYVKPTKVESFSIRCAELCGIWHGYMFDTGHIVTASAFATWIAAQQKAFAPITKHLPPYALTYQPQPSERGS
jgi:cytochrome c oxidase subunit II